MADKKIKLTISKVKLALTEHRALRTQHRKNPNPSDLLNEIYDEVELRIKDMIVNLVVEPDIPGKDLQKKD